MQNKAVAAMRVIVWSFIGGNYFQLAAILAIHSAACGKSHPAAAAVMT
jgi:hypothetical protein